MTYKRIGFIGNPPSLPEGSRDNTGNIIHGYAAREMFGSKTGIKSEPTPENIADVRERVDCVGFVAATMLHINHTPKYAQSHERAATFIEQLGLPVCTFGFGCSAPLGATIASAKVDERSVRLLRAISANATRIAVRGEFTADLCAKFGVKNVEVVGCQSAYYAGVNNWQSKVRVTGPVVKPVVNLTLATDERDVLRLAMRAGADIIGQNDPTEDAICKGEIDKDAFSNRNDDMLIRPFVREWFRDGSCDPGTYFDYMREHFKKFYTVPDWVTHIRNHYDFCYGTRFHGNMVALQSGVPALWLVHDMRTWELCKHLNLPNVAHADVHRYASVQQLADQCDYSAFWAGFPARLQQFLGYLDANGVTSLLDKEFAASATAICQSRSSEANT